MNSKWIDLNVKLLDENVRANACGLILGTSFFNSSPKAQITTTTKQQTKKTDTLEIVKLKKFVC